MGIPEPDPNFTTRTRPDPNKYGLGMGMHNMGRVENGLTRTRPDPTRLPGLKQPPKKRVALLRHAHALSGVPNLGAAQDWGRASTGRPMTGSSVPIKSGLSMACFKA